jgi:large subunit ribosomal protein L9
MRIVLLDDIITLGDAGEIVEVKDGYARNYLIPKQLAERATRDAINRIETIKRAAEAKRARRLGEAAAQFNLLADKTLVIQMKSGTESRLFGAVTSAMIADEVYRQFEVELDRRMVMLDEPIKHLGEFTIPLKASADVTGELKLTVEPELSPEELEARLIEQERQRLAEEEAAKAAEAGEPEAEEAAEAVEAAEKYADEAARYAEQDEAVPEPPE